MDAVTKQEYIAEMNRRLKTHADFKPGMRFLFNALDYTATGSQPFAAVRASMVSDGWTWEGEPPVSPE